MILAMMARELGADSVQANINVMLASLPLLNSSALSTMIKRIYDKIELAGALKNMTQDLKQFDTFANTQKLGKIYEVMSRAGLAG